VREGVWDAMGDLKKRRGEKGGKQSKMNVNEGGSTGGMNWLSQGEAGNFSKVMSGAEGFLDRTQGSQVPLDQKITLDPTEVGTKREIRTA